MSWDIAFDPASGGSMSSCRALAARISALVPGIAWEKNESWGVLEGEGFSIEFNLASAETGSFMIHVRGGNGCHEPLLALTGAADWVATDMGSGETLDPAEDGRGAVVRMFCSFCDEDRFVRFISELLWEAENEGRLTEWQAELLEEFCSEFGISPVPALKAVKSWPW